MKKRDLIIGLLAALFIAAAASPFASSFPDGLEKVAEKLGFIEKGEGTEILKSPIPDYQMPGIKKEWLATASAGAAGTIVVFGLTYGISRLIVGRKTDKK